MVIDSHALLWWLERRPELSAKAEGLLNSANAERGQFYVASISFWELRMKELRGQLRPTRPVREWPALLDQLSWFNIENTSPEVWMRSAELGWAHRDPADRILAAIALHHSVPLLTKDRIFHTAEAPVQAVW